jgi:hypothetical protein
MRNFKGAKVHSIKSLRRSFSLLRNPIIVISAIVGVAASGALAQSVPVVTGDSRVDKLLSQMTLQEKLTLIHGTQEDPSVYQGQAGYLAGIPRLHIPGCVSPTDLRACSRATPRKAKPRPWASPPPSALRTRKTMAS